MPKKRMNKISLNDVLALDKFMQELERAATMVYHGMEEAGFGVYANLDLSQISVNQAIGCDEYGNMNLQQGSKEPSKGYHVPDQHYRLVDFHFHPPSSRLVPSSFDLAYHFISRIENNKEPQNKEPVEFYVNPVSIIGMVHENPRSVELLVYQGITGQPETYEDADSEKMIDSRTGGRMQVPKSINTFIRYDYEHCGKEKDLIRGPRPYSCKDLTYFLGTFHFPSDSVDQVVNFLQDSGCFRSTSFTVQNGVISASEKELENFGFIQQ